MGFQIPFLNDDVSRFDKPFKEGVRTHSLLPTIVPLSKSWE